MQNGITYHATFPMCVGSTHYFWFWRPCLHFIWVWSPSRGRYVRKRCRLHATIYFAYILILNTVLHIDRNTFKNQGFLWKNKTEHLLHLSRQIKIRYIEASFRFLIFLKLFYFLSGGRTRETDAGRESTARNAIPEWGGANIIVYTHNNISIHSLEPNFCTENWAAQKQASTEDGGIFNWSRD